MYNEFQNLIPDQFHVNGVKEGQLKYIWGFLLMLHEGFRLMLSKKMFRVF